MSSDGHSVAYYCPFCGEEQLEPEGEEAGRWHCHSCTRSFTVRLVRRQRG